MNESSDPNDSLGTLGDYTLRRVIARGPMGVMVYEAWENSVDRAVALKVISCGVGVDEESFNSFVRGARVARRLSHPNVVAVHSVGRVENTPYYAMALVQGKTLAETIARLQSREFEAETFFGVKDSLDYFLRLAEAFAGVADGLHHAHSKGVVHRDIKPSNLLLDEEGGLRITDFDAAQIEDQESLTASANIIGTPKYMSPEQVCAPSSVDHRTDVYSLGATMYTTFTGRPPFLEDDIPKLLSQVVEEEPPYLRKANPRVPRDLESIVLKCLSKNVEDRYDTAENLAQDLRRFARQDSFGDVRPQSAFERLVRRIFRRYLKRP